jgi:hypothetical protein
MPTTVDDIKDVLAGAEYCKERMKRCEANAEQARQKGDLLLVAKFEGHLFAWTELLQKYMHESFNQGKTTDDLLLTPVSGKNKRRYNADKPGRKGADSTSQPRAMGDGPHAPDVGVEKHAAVAAPGFDFPIPSPHTQMLTPEWEVINTERKVLASSADDRKGSDTDNSGTEAE